MAIVLLCESTKLLKNARFELYRNNSIDSWGTLPPVLTPMSDPGVVVIVCWQTCRKYWKYAFCNSYILHPMQMHHLRLSMC